MNRGEKMTRVLLIGIEEKPEMRKGFGDHVVFFKTSATTESAKSFLSDADLFLLDGSLGTEACTDFLNWAIQSTMCYGIIVEEICNLSLCIAGINAGIICDHVILPATAERYAEAWQRYQNRLERHISSR